MKVIKNNIKLFIGIAIGILISGGVVYAANLLSSSEVTYTNSDSSVTNVKDALDELYRKASISCPYDIGHTWDFDYTGSIQNFITQCEGKYRLEVWGASGNISDSQYAVSAYGGYSVGEMNLNKSDILYVTVGGQGISAIGTTSDGGYNGGGSSKDWSDGRGAGSGGGATHISTEAGLLANFENNRSALIIVAGGGGGIGNHQNKFSTTISAGSGGGFKGVNGVSESLIGYGGTQEAGGATTPNGNHTGTGGSFGQGGSCSDGTGNCSGGGGGYYGGGSNTNFSGGGGGGSGYLSNSLTNKKMVCYNCEENGNDSTKTLTTTCKNESASSSCAKIGNGYAKITYLGSN